MQRLEPVDFIQHTADKEFTTGFVNWADTFADFLFCSINE